MNNTTTEIAFTKMQGAGNDFIIIDNRVGLFNKEQIISLAPKLCDRRFGIGADGVILLQQSDDPDLDYTMFYRNADGSDAGMCGNGARCLALYASKLGLGEELRFNVHDHIYQAEVEAEQNQVTVSFPMNVEVEEVALENGSLILRIQAGTEHIVKEVSKEKLQDEDFLTKTGKKLRNHPKFSPPGTNVNFIHGSTEDALTLQTYERGVEGLTLACGTGAIASALAWHHIQGTDNKVETSTNIEVKGGNLQVYFTFDENEKVYKNIRLAGEAQFVFKGIYTV